MGWVRCSGRGWNSATSRWRHPALGGWPVSTVAPVDTTGTAGATLLGGSAGAGDFPRTPGSLDSAQLAAISPLRTAGPTLCQRSGRVRSFRLRSLDAHLDRRLCFDRRNLLAG